MRSREVEGARLCAAVLGLCGLSACSFERTYGEAYTLAAGYSARQIDLDSYVLAGSVYDGPHGWDGYLVKTDALGQELWHRTYGGAGADEAFAMDATSDGGFVLAGRTSSSSAGGYDIWLVKTTADGAEQWNRTFGGADDEEAYAVAQTRDGGYVVAGFTSSILREAYLLKTDPDGVEEWHRTFDAGGKDPTALSVRPTIDGGYVFAGSTYTPDNPADAWVVKTDASGEPEWQRELGGSGVDYGFAIAPTLDGGYILAGGTSDGIAYPGQASLWKLASSGDEEWTRAYARGVASSARAVVQTDDGGYAFAADVAGSESRTDIHLVRTDGAGSEEWRRAFGTGYAVPYSVQQTSDGGYVIGGEIGAHAEAYLVKVAPRLLLP